MAIAVNNIKINLNENEEDIKKRAAKELRINKNDIEGFKILRESVDARRKEIKLVYRVLVEIRKERGSEENILKKSKSKNASIYRERKENIISGEEEIKGRIVVAGSGPAGLFAAHRLASHGYRPLIIERGMKVRDRKKAIDNFWKTGKLNPESNVQFGEGGAGTFSDGKLTTRIKDGRVGEVLDIFIKNGAPEEIGYSYKPHIGTDILIDVIESLRKEIENLGGEFRFSTKLEKINISSGRLQSITVRDVSSKEGETYDIETENLILAIGHSARDSYEMLYEEGLGMEQKPFAIGVRVEHPQDMIDENQYGEYKDHPKLKASEYKLTYRAESGRSCYSFCMCPGGTVVASASEEGYLAVNGMSEYARDKENANSAIIVSVKEDDFGSDHPLAGVEFQRKYEKLAFELSEGSYKAPVQLLGDFEQGRVTEKLGEINPSHTGGYIFKDINKCLPDYVSDTIKEAMKYFDTKIKGFGRKDTVLTGIETRTSAPIRMNRDEKHESNIKGLYPAGEGAGYAGGIVSAAVDGMKTAEEIIRRYRP